MLFKLFIKIAYIMLNKYSDSDSDSDSDSRYVKSGTKYAT